MNSKSLRNFRWSVKLTGNHTQIFVGITSKLHHTDGWIQECDKNAVIYAPFERSIWKGEKSMKITSENCAEDGTLKFTKARDPRVSTRLDKAKCGDEIHFKFQPREKMFSIIFVSLINYPKPFMIPYLRKANNFVTNSKKMWTIFQLYKQIVALLLLPCSNLKKISQCLFSLNKKI